MKNIQHVSTADWKTLEAGDKPVLVDFWAEWCGPCRALEPAMEKLAARYGDEFVFAKVNVDQEPELGNRFSVQAIPTLILFEKGRIVERMVGLRSYTQLAEILENHRPAVLPN